jgi:hypothetical protein
MVVATPKEFERERVTAGTFSRLAAEMLSELAGPAGDADYAAFLDKQPAGKVALLTELARQQNMVSLLRGMRVPTVRPNDKPEYLLSTSTLLLLRGKAVTLSVYTAFDSPADIDWIRAVTARWVEDVKRLNGR